MQTNNASRDLFTATRSTLAAMARGNTPAAQRAKRALAALEGSNDTAPKRTPGRTQPMAASDPSGAPEVFHRSVADLAAKRMLDIKFGLLKPDPASVEITPHKITFGGGFWASQPMAAATPNTDPSGAPEVYRRTPAELAAKRLLDIKFGLLKPDHTAVEMLPHKLTFGATRYR